MGETPTALATMLTNIGTFFTTSIGWLGDILDYIVGNPALLILCIAMPIIGFAVSLLNRLIRL